MVIKSLSISNFLTDNRVIERIVATIAPKFNDNLLEIGPGQGAMTRAKGLR
jgi:16S rRNA (adenine1518-N6/adenine1519-N6)-dimethyltransferase